MRSGSLAEHLGGPVRGQDLAIAVFAFALVLSFFVLRSQPRKVGDGAEYLAMAQSISELKHPAPGPERLAELQQDFADLGAGFELLYPPENLVAQDGRQEWPHFWLYPALAAPLVGLANVLDVHPNYGFAALNGALLLLAFAVVSRFISLSVAALLAFSPILWWVDKTHTEAFTVALLLITFALIRTHPWWSLVALAVASTQNLPIAFAIPVITVAVIAADRRYAMDRRLWGGLGVAIAIALLHPLYYFLRLGAYTSQAVIGAVAPTMPNPAHLAAVLVDPNIGLLWNFPLIAPILIVFAVVPVLHRGAGRPRADLAAAAVCLVVFLIAFTQTPNLNSGATPGISRYALWLIPLLLPVFAHVQPAWTPRIRTSFVAAVLLSGFVISLLYHPLENEDHIHPSWLANLVWTHAPALDNPPIQIFFERTAHGEMAAFPVATPSCSKVLVVDGRWPDTCGPPPDIPIECRGAGTACYANRIDDGFRFEVAPPP